MVSQDASVTIVGLALLCAPAVMVAKVGVVYNPAVCVSVAVTNLGAARHLGDLAPAYRRAGLQAGLSERQWVRPAFRGLHAWMEMRGSTSCPTRVFRAPSADALPSQRCGMALSRSGQQYTLLFLQLIHRRVVAVAADAFACVW